MWRVLERRGPGPPVRTRGPWGRSAGGPQPAGLLAPHRLHGRTTPPHQLPRQGALLRNPFLSDQPPERACRWMGSATADAVSPRRCEILGAAVGPARRRLDGRLRLYGHLDGPAVGAVVESVQAGAFSGQAGAERRCAVHAGTPGAKRGWWAESPATDWHRRRIDLRGKAASSARRSRLLLHPPVAGLGGGGVRLGVAPMFQGGRRVGGAVRPLAGPLTRPLYHIYSRCIRKGVFMNRYTIRRKSSGRKGLRRKARKRSRPGSKQGNK